MSMIDKSFDIAQSYGVYDYFIRYRPDFIMVDPIYVENINNFHSDTIYTTRKSDSSGSDQVFLISANMSALVG